LKVLTVLLHLVHHFLIFKKPSLKENTKVYAMNSSADKNSNADLENIGQNDNQPSRSPKNEKSSSWNMMRSKSSGKLGNDEQSKVALPKRNRFVLVAVKDVGITIAVATRVAMTVMVLVIIVPFLVFVEPDTGGDAWLDSSIILAQSETTNEVAVLKFAHGVEHFFKNKGTKLHSLRIESPYLPEAFEREYHTRAVLREESILELSAGFSMLNSDIVKHGLNHTVVKCMSCSTHFESVIELDVTHEMQMNALYSMMISLLVLLVLIGSTVTFVHVVHSLPMEELVDFCRSLALHLDAKIQVKL